MKTSDLNVNSSLCFPLWLKFLEHQFQLKAAPSKRVDNYRIRFKGTSDNILRLRELVKPHMHDCMLYKLGINIDSIKKNQ